MNRDRFQLINSFNHFADIETVDTSDPLYKIKDLIRMVNERNQAVLKPGKCNVVDETMKHWRGRLRFRVYNPMKANKYGMKIYKFTTVDSFVLNSKVYCGAENRNERDPPVSEAVVMDLMENYLDKGRTVYADNFFSGIPLVGALANRSTYYCGTVRKDRRGLPENVSRASLKRGEIAGSQCQHGTKVLNWRDKRNVMMITNVRHHDETLGPAGENLKPNSIPGVPGADPERR